MKKQWLLWLGLWCIVGGLWGLPQTAFAQETVMLTGVVTDTHNEPLPGVTIQVVNAAHGAYTDANGSYTLRVPGDLPATARVKFSQVGMADAEVVYGKKTRIDVQMQENSRALQEVVVTGVMNMQRRDMVGSFTTIKADSIMMPAYNSIDEMLAGQVAGMMVRTTDMRAGASPSIMIRGKSTLLGSTEPLWVVDGIVQPNTMSINGEFDGAELGSAEMNSIISSQIAWLNPADIENINVLKDASATAIYGSRASNGVIVITTKRGQADRLSVRASANFTVGERLHYGLYNLMNSQERINFSKEAFNSGVYYQYDPLAQTYTYEGMYNMFLSGAIAEQDFIRRYNFLETINTDWLKLLTRPSFNQNYSVNVSGGTQKATYVASISYANNAALEKGNSNERLTGRLAVGFDLGSKIHVDASINASMGSTESFAGAVNPISYALATSRAVPAYEENGELAFYRRRDAYSYNEETLQYGLPYNVLDDRANTLSRVDNPTMQASLDFKWELLPDLTYQVVGGFITNSRASEQWLGEDSYHVIQYYRGYHTDTPESIDPRYQNAAILKNGGVLITDHTSSKTYNVRNQLNYTRTFADVHRITAMAMWEINSTARNSKYNTVFGYDKLRGETVAAPTNYTDLEPIGRNKPTSYVETYDRLSSGYWRSTNHTDNKASLAMIAAYSLMNKYVFNANFRNDWSNTFGQNANKRFNPAFSVGAAWKIMEEEFMQSMRSWLSTADFSLTYGTQGNVANTLTTEMVLQIQPVHQLYGEPYSSIARIANPYMTWERTTNWNGGLDLGFFNDRFSIEVDAYTRLSNVGRDFTDTPENGQFSAALTGTFIRNTGVEFTLNAIPYQARGWRVSLSTNFSKNWNKVVKEEQKDITAGNTHNYINGGVIEPGYPTGAFWAYPYAAPDPATGIPTFHGTYTSAANKIEGVRAPDFLTYIGSREPDITAGLNLRVSYKNLSISSQLAVTLGGKDFLYNPYEPFAYGRMPDPTTNLNKELLDRWTPANTSSTIPGLYVVDSEQNNPLTLYDRSGIGMDRYVMWANSDARVASLSSLRCRSINLTYSIRGEKAPVLQRLHLRNIDLTAAVNNVFLIADAKWKGMDPDLGGDRKAPRSFTFGVNFGF